MKTRSVVTAIVGGFTLAAPLIGALCDAITKDKEMDDIADRVVKKLEEKEKEAANVKKAETSEK